MARVTCRKIKSNKRVRNAPQVTHENLRLRITVSCALCCLHFHSLSLFSVASTIHGSMMSSASPDHRRRHRSTRCSLCRCELSEVFQSLDSCSRSCRVVALLSVPRKDVVLLLCFFKFRVGQVFCSVLTS
eukprot:scpid33058/ scgid20555/ 